MVLYIQNTFSTFLLNITFTTKAHICNLSECISLEKTSAALGYSAKNNHAKNAAKPILAAFRGPKNQKRQKSTNLGSTNQKSLLRAFSALKTITPLKTIPRPKNRAQPILASFNALSANHNLTELLQCIRHLSRKLLRDWRQVNET